MIIDTPTKILVNVMMVSSAMAVIIGIMMINQGHNYENTSVPSSVSAFIDYFSCEREIPGNFDSEHNAINHTRVWMTSDPCRLTAFDYLFLSKSARTITPGNMLSVWYNTSIASFSHGCVKISPPMVPKWDGSWVGTPETVAFLCLMHMRNNVCNKDAICIAKADERLESLRYITHVEHENNVKLPRLQ